MAYVKKAIQFDLTALAIETLPHSDELEQSVLATIIDIPDTLNQVAKFLSPVDMFFGHYNGQIWQEIVQMNEQAGSIGFEGLLGRIQGKRDKDLVNHLNYLRIKCGNGTHLLIPHCLKLNEYWVQRALHRYGYYVNQYALRQDIDSLDLLGQATEALDRIYKHLAGLNEKSIAESISDVAGEIARMQSSPKGITGLASTINGINSVIKGYRKSLLVVIGASTREGKTTLAIQETRSWIEQDIPIGYWSGEMTSGDLLIMMACDALNFDTGAVFEGNLTAEQSKLLGNYLNRLKSMPFYLSDKPALKIGELKALARLWVKEHGIKALIVDHMHLMYDDVDHGSNSEQRFTNIANKLKELAKELEIPIIALAQLARKEQGEKKRAHQITDLKYAGGIEQAADVIMLIYRPELHGIDQGPNGESTVGFTKIIVGKLRLLPMSDIKCHFTGQHFEDADVFVDRQMQPQPDNPYKGFQNARTPYVDNNFFNEP